MRLKILLDTPIWKQQHMNPHFGGNHVKKSHIVFALAPIWGDIWQFNLEKNLTNAKLTAFSSSQTWSMKNCFQYDGAIVKVPSTEILVEVPRRWKRGSFIINSTRSGWISPPRYCWTEAWRSNIVLFLFPDLLKRLLFSEFIKILHITCFGVLPWSHLPTYWWETKFY